jgi:hypothetical protein
MLTSKQLGDAGELLVAAQLTLHGIPAYIVPTNWPGYDVAADLQGKGVQRISVKTRTRAGGSRSVAYSSNDQFDWLAIVILDDRAVDDTTLQRSFVTPQIFIMPRTIAEERAGKRNHPPLTIATSGPDRGWQLSKLREVLGDFENNFTLEPGLTLLQSN